MRKIQPKYVDGVFLGVQEGTELKWIGAAEGVVRAWSLKLKPEAESWDKQRLEEIIGRS